MTNSRLGIGVVGMGFMGRAFAQICTQLPGTQLVGVSDIDEQTGEAAANQFSVPFYNNFADLIARPELQAIIVATSEDAHVDPSVCALEHGKSVMVEKPIADTVANGRKIAAANAGGKATLMVGHVLRYATHYCLMKQAVDSGSIGQVQCVYTRRLNGRGAQNRLHGRSPLPVFLGVHDYDVAHWFANSKPTRVYAESQWTVLKGLGYNVEDTNWAMINFENGVLAVCETGWILPGGHPSGFDGGVAVQGTTGRLDMQLNDQGIKLSTDAGTVFPDTTFMPRAYGELRSSFVYEIEHFANCILTGREPLTNAADAILAMEIAEAVMESARTHQPVVLS